MIFRNVIPFYMKTYLPRRKPSSRLKIFRKPYVGKTEIFATKNVKRLNPLRCERGKLASNIFQDNMLDWLVSFWSFFTTGLYKCIFLQLNNIVEYIYLLCFLLVIVVVVAYASLFHSFLFQVQKKGYFDGISP